MSRRVTGEARVAMSAGRPQLVAWPGGRGRVLQVIDDWRYAGRWWDRELRRDYYLLELDSGQVLELYREEGRWCVTRLQD